MQDLPKRKEIRLKEFDYLTPGAYFITVCTANRENLFWSDRRGDLWSPAQLPLSDIGILITKELEKLNHTYSALHLDTYCIMPDHIHMILSISTDANGRPQVAPTISRVIQQFNGSVSKQIGKAIWQKSFYDHGIRNAQDYNEIRKYIENNPLKHLQQAEG